MIKNIKIIAFLALFPFNLAMGSDGESGGEQVQLPFKRTMSAYEEQVQGSRFNPARSVIIFDTKQYKRAKVKEEYNDIHRSYEILATQSHRDETEESAILASKRKCKFYYHYHLQCGPHFFANWLIKSIKGDLAKITVNNLWTTETIEKIKKKRRTYLVTDQKIDSETYKNEINEVCSRFDDYKEDIGQKFAYEQFIKILIKKADQRILENDRRKREKEQKKLYLENDAE
ncbi:MAG: hypothetical protein V4544_06175 [Pseudomonadota bacterium]